MNFIRICVPAENLSPKSEKCTCSLMNLSYNLEAAHRTVCLHSASLLSVLSCLLVSDLKFSFLSLHLSRFFKPQLLFRQSILSVISYLSFKVLTTF